MVQGLTRFILGHISKDFQRISPHSADLEEVGFPGALPGPPAHFIQILATSAMTLMQCTNCKTETTRPGSTYVNELKYPVAVRAPCSKSKFNC